MNYMCVFSKDRKYRYVWRHGWDADKPIMMFVGLNPSTADEKEKDPTVTRCVNLAKREGCGTLIMMNIFAIRSTDPKVLYDHDSPIGEDNDLWLKRIAESAKIIVGGWGVHGKLNNRGNDVLKLFDKIYCLGTNKDGTPKHPLYLRKDTPLIKLGNS